MMVSWDSSVIKAAFAEAALDRSKWNRAMDIVAAATGSMGAVLLPVPARTVPMIPSSESLGATTEVYVAQGWADHDVRYRGIPKFLKTNVMCDLDFVTPDEIKKSAYYQDFLAQFGLRWFAGVKLAAGEEVWALSIQRSIEQGPFSAEELGRLAVLAGPLSSAATTAHALSFARAEGALSAFAVSNLPAALLNRSGQVMQINQAAEKLFGSDVLLHGGRVVSQNHDATIALDRALHAVMTSADSSILMPPVPLPRVGYQRPLLAYAVRLGTVSHDAFAPCQAILLFVDLDAQSQPPEGVLRQCFGLSAAEARLAIGLAAGKTLEALAEELAIARDTARHQLKSVFAKLDVHRQSELISLLAKLLRGGRVEVEP